MRLFTLQKGLIGFGLLLLIGAAIAFRHSFMPRSSASSTGKAFHREALRVAVLRGPSVVAVTSWLENPPLVGEHPLAMKVLDSPELLQAALIKGEADVAMLPLISAANLYNKGVPLRMIGCPIWGTLYMVERPTATSKTPLHLFGSGLAHKAFNLPHIIKAIGHLYTWYGRRYFYKAVIHVSKCLFKDGLKGT